MSIETGVFRLRPLSMRAVAIIDRFRDEALALGLSLYFCVFLNGALWRALHESQGDLPLVQRVALLLCIGSGVTAFQFVVISLLMWGRFVKVSAFTILALAASFDHFGVGYKTVFDSSMMRNILATNPQEAGELLTAKSLGEIALAMMPPAIALLFFRPSRLPLRQIVWAKGVVVLVSFGVVASCLGLQFRNIASLVRNQREVRHLVFPTAPLLSLMRVISEGAARAGTRREVLDPLAHRKISISGRPLLTVVVVGETVRAQNWGLSGYQRNTTPRLAGLSKDELFNFPYATSCGTNTEVSVPCMFSGIGRNDYDANRIRRYESILSLIQRVGVDVAWIDNQSGCKGVCDGVSAHRPDPPSGGANSTELLDDALLEALQKRISYPARDQLIVLHMMGNHGPAYFNRYSAKFRRFVPECRDRNLASCSPEAIVNAYDNAIVNTDSLLADMIEHLSGISDRAVSLIYVSDHGESLGEKGVYLHGLPTFIAPQEQTRVPFVVWLPRSTQAQLSLSPDCLAARAQNPTEHDLLAHSLLGAYRIQTSIYRQSWNFLAPCGN